MKNQNRQQFEAQVEEMETTTNEGDAINVTLLELVKAVTEVSDNENEVIATVAHMLESGSVSLTGCLRDEPRQLVAM